MMLPKTTWPTSPGSIPARATASRTHRAASSLGGMSFKLPPKPPIAVRTPLRMTTSRVLFIASPPVNGSPGTPPRRGALMQGSYQPGHDTGEREKTAAVAHFRDHNKGLVTDAVLFSPRAGVQLRFRLCGYATP